MGTAPGVGCQTAPGQGRGRVGPDSTRLWHFEAVLRQCKDALERKYDQQHVADLNKQLETAHRTVRALGLWPFCRLNSCWGAAYPHWHKDIWSFQFLLHYFLDQIIFITPLVRRQTWMDQSQQRNWTNSRPGSPQSAHSMQRTTHCYVLLHITLITTVITPLLQNFLVITTAWLLLHYYVLLRNNYPTITTYSYIITTKSLFYYS
jgi:hypothetical protein